jgi:hypothetical protein
MKRNCILLPLLSLLSFILSILHPIRGFAGISSAANREHAIGASSRFKAVGQINSVLSPGTDNQTDSRHNLRTGNRADSQLRDGQHDFDFNIGNWHTHIKRLLHPLSGSNDWVELNGTVVVRKVWNGRAQLEEIEADGSVGHFEGMTLFLYDPKAHQWSLSFASSDDGILGPPAIGEFKNGRGEFFDQETYNGRAIMVKGVWSDITPGSHRFEQSFSDDGGKTWETNFIANLTPDKQDAASAGAQPATGQVGPLAGQSVPIAGQEVPHDFDFAIGSWKEHTSRLQHPLTGSTTWIEMEGVSVASKIWNGRGNLTELESDGPNGHLELLALRLYNPQSHQWNLTFATSNVGILGMPPTIGEFRNGRGEFYDQEQYNDKTIWLRFSIIPINSDSMRSEQAFSNDGGKTWETNWINKYTRLRN